MTKKKKKIQIKKSKEGTFTKAAKKRGMSVQGFASLVLANKDNYSSAMVKKANFARNSAKWKKQEGGELEYFQKGKSQGNKKIDLKLKEKKKINTSPFRFTARPTKKDKLIKNINLGSKYNLSPKFTVSGNLNQNLSNLSWTPPKRSKTPTDLKSAYENRPGIKSNIPTMNLKGQYNITPGLSLSSGISTNFQDPTNFNAAATFNKGPVGFGGKFNSDFLDKRNLILEARQRLGKNTNVLANFNTNFDKGRNLGLEVGQKIGPVKFKGKFNTDFDQSNKLGLGIGTKLGKNVNLNTRFGTDFKNVGVGANLDIKANPRLNIRGGLGYNTKGELSGSVGLNYNPNMRKPQPKKNIFKQQEGGVVDAPEGYHWMKQSNNEYKLMKHKGQFVQHPNASLNAKFSMQTKHKNGGNLPKFQTGSGPIINNEELNTNFVQPDENNPLNYFPGISQYTSENFKKYPGSSLEKEGHFGKIEAPVTIPHPKLKRNTINFQNKYNMHPSSTPAGIKASEELAYEGLKEGIQYRMPCTGGEQCAGGMNTLSTNYKQELYDELGIGIKAERLYGDAWRDTSTDKYNVTWTNKDYADQIDVTNTESTKKHLTYKPLADDGSVNQWPDDFFAIGGEDMYEGKMIMGDRKNTTKTKASGLAAALKGEKPGPEHQGTIGPVREHPYLKNPDGTPQIGRFIAHQFAGKEGGSANATTKFFQDWVSKTDGWGYQPGENKYTPARIWEEKEIANLKKAVGFKKDLTKEFKPIKEGSQAISSGVKDIGNSIFNQFKQFRKMLPINRYGGTQGPKYSHHVCGCNNKKKIKKGGILESYQQGGYLPKYQTEGEIDWENLIPGGPAEMLGQPQQYRHGGRIKMQLGGDLNNFPNATSYNEVGALPDNKINYKESTIANKVGRPNRFNPGNPLFRRGGNMNTSMELIDKNDMLHPADSDNLSYDSGQPIGFKMTTIKQSHYEEGGNVASTPQEFSEGLNTGTNVFKFPRKGLKKMTMNPKSGPIKYPVEMKGFTDGELTDNKLVNPGEDVNINGDTVVEVPDLSEMEFNEAFDYANKNKLPIFKWKDNEYPIKKNKKYQDGGLFSSKVTNKVKLDPGFKPEGNIN